MKNKYEIVEAGEVITLTDEFKNSFSIIAEKRTVIIYANGDHRKDWKIIIDEDDLAKVNAAVDGRWYVDVSKGTIYAKFCKQIKGEREYISMHRLISDCPIDLVVDHHPNHYGLDNRKSNLTNVTMIENSCNKVMKRARIGSNVDNN